ncbi:MAG: hypothetical protein SGPRY_010667, partial [Prymnesium sp.]
LCASLGMSEKERDPFLRILVTGGCGFLGSHLCRRLVAEGHDVVALDNFFTSQKTNVKVCRGKPSVRPDEEIAEWADLLDKPNFEVIRHDVTQEFFIEVDQIYNMACPASPVHYQYNPVKTMKTSILGTMNMLGLAKRVKARILQASTSEVYGDPTISPQPEEYWGNVNCNGVRSCYDEGKRAAETLCFDYHRQNGVDIRVVRIFNTYGPGMHPYDGRVVSNFLVQALNGEDITVYGEGEQTRSFCSASLIVLADVDDLIDGIIRLMNQDETTGPVNIGNPCEFTIKELAELAIKKEMWENLTKPDLLPQTTKSKSKIVYLPLPGDDPKQRKPDITKVEPSSLTPSCSLASSLPCWQARKYLGWEPKVPLEKGIVKAAEYFGSLDLTCANTHIAVVLVCPVLPARVVFSSSINRPLPSHRRFKKPTKHTAHLNTEQIEGSAAKKQKV